MLGEAVGVASLLVLFGSAPPFSGPPVRSLPFASESSHSLQSSSGVQPGRRRRAVFLTRVLLLLPVPLTNPLPAQNKSCSLVPAPLLFSITSQSLCTERQTVPCLSLPLLAAYLSLTWPCPSLVLALALALRTRCTLYRRIAGSER
jgi:hypothetical protein